MACHGTAILGGLTFHLIAEGGAKSLADLLAAATLGLSASRFSAILTARVPQQDANSKITTATIKQTLIIFM